MADKERCAKIVLGVDHPLGCRLAPPVNGFTIILWNTMAVMVSVAEIMQRMGISLFRRHAKPLYGLDIILLHAVAEIV